MTTGRVRLHISPFTRDSAPSIIPATLSAQAENISFHSIQTVPGNSFGYVDLPQMEAERLKKKLNGSILKGKKIRIEEARPSKRPRQEVDGGAVTAAQKPSAQAITTRLKKSKKDDQLINGFEMPDDRKVKRGWTEPRRKERKKSSTSGKTEAPPSKYTEKQECLFRSQLPENKVDLQDMATGKEKKTKTKGKGQVLVHEFQKSTSFPSFLRSNTEDVGSTLANKFVEGKGWVNESGDVVEKPPQQLARPQAQIPRPKKRKASLKEDSSSEPGSGTDTPRIGAEHFQERTFSAAVQAGEDETSSSGSSLTSSSGSDSEYNSEDDAEGSDAESEKSVSTTPQLQSSQDITPTIRLPSSVTQVTPHPLEALFKRPPQPQPTKQSSTLSNRSTPKPSLEISTSFSFFDPDDIEQSPSNADAVIAKEPLTPFSSQDHRFRRIRSAAPTPDTAAPSRTSYFSGGSQPESVSESEAEDIDRDEATPVQNTVSTNDKKGKKKTSAQSETATPKVSVSVSQQQQGEGEQEQSDFVKWFYAHRGENNRLWKKRRREAAKEKRQAENRRDAQRARRR